MVQASLAVGEDTTSIELEVGGVDSDGGHSLGSVGLEAAAVSVSSGEDWIDLGASSGDLAFSGDGSVGVVALVNETVVLDVVHGVFGNTTAAPVVSVGSGAVDELLFGEVSQFAGRPLDVAFNGSHGTESPAWPAGSLVLDVAHSSRVSPVDGVGNVVGDEQQFFFLLLFLLGHDQSQVGAHELLLGDVHELGELQGVALLRSIVELLDGLVILIEHSESVVVLFFGVVFLVVFTLPVVV